MAKGSVTMHSPDAPESLDENFPGLGAIRQLLASQAALPRRNLLRRIMGVSPLNDETRTLYARALGEIEVGAVLDGLGEGWVTVHAVPVGTGMGAATINHLVIGPGGVFVVDTRSHSGQAVWASQRTFMVAGERHPHIRNMESEMGRVERMLSAASGGPVEVEGILAVVAPKSLTVRQKHRDVAVVSADALAEWLRELPRVLSDVDVQRISASARKAATWDAGEPPASGPEQLRTGFDLLREEVVLAWRLQVFWVTLVTVIAAGGFMLLAWSIMANALVAAAA